MGGQEAQVSHRGWYANEKNDYGIPGWLGIPGLSGLGPAFGPGPDPGVPGWSPVSGSGMEPASPSACVSAPLFLYHE